MLDTDHFVACTADRPNDFVEFQVQCTSVPILSVLDQKNETRNVITVVAVFMTNCQVSEY